MKKSCWNHILYVSVCGIILQRQNQVYKKRLKLSSLAYFNTLAHAPGGPFTKRKPTSARASPIWLAPSG
jgi:hypothetical protein